uniref:Protein VERNALIZATION INSENSITIVE 3 n=2 Tax=Anthurium amnicola TaxID=1678845 RepID=A0A1D1YIM4_9ARAE
MRSPVMDPSFAGFALDPSKCSKLSTEEKRDLVYELSKWRQDAPELLQSWSRKDLLELLCLEMGKERKYTGLTKYKLIEHLLKIVCENKSGRPAEDITIASPSPPISPPPSKRQRKSAHPSRLLVGSSHSSDTNTTEFDTKSLYCRNLACRATMSLGDAFCKRCSCCICYKYDDNKDPSLWLVCSSDVPSEDNSCGMSCHLECALKDEKAGIANSGSAARLDGGFCCVSCGKVNDLLGCWRKQLTIAKDARRVDILCYRVSLSHKLLNGTEKFENLHEIVDSIVKKLEVEVGALDGLPIKMARGIVNRLSSGAEVQKLCAIAVAMLDSVLSAESHLPLTPKNQKSCIPSTMISFEDVSSTHLTLAVGSVEDIPLSGIVDYTLWHRRADMVDYPAEPTCKLITPGRKFLVSDLMPATEYMFKVVAFSNSDELGKWEVGMTTSSISKDVTVNTVVTEDSLKPNCESPKANSSDLSNPSEGDESNNTAAFGDLDKLPETCSGYCEKPEIPDLEKPLYSENTGTGVIHGINEVTEHEMPSPSVFAEEEPSSTIQTDSHKDSTNSTDVNQASDVPKSENESNAPLGNEMLVIPYGRSEAVLPVTPSKLETSKEGVGRGGRSKPGSGGPDNWFPKPEKEPRMESSSKKRSGARCEELCTKDGSLEGDYEYCVKVVRWLECEGHIETNFRVKFLTWFSLRATPQERRVVSVFVDTMIDDPHSLAGQLIDTFSEAICKKLPFPSLPSGFCTKLWH